jgi:hypothetical protein
VTDESSPPWASGAETVSLGARQVVVEHSPLPDTQPAGFRDKTLAHPRKGCLELRPNRTARCFGLVWLLLGGLCSIPALGLLLGGWKGFPLRMAAIVSLMAVCFLALGVYKLVRGGHHFRFDHDTRRVSEGVILVRDVCALGDVLAVQVVFGGRHTALGRTTPFRTYQLNLVLDYPWEQLAGFREEGDAGVFAGDARSHRLNLTHHPDLVWTRQAGRELADFLRVPLLDQVGATE